MRPRAVCVLALCAGLFLAGASGLRALDKKKMPFAPTSKPTPPEEALHAYVERVRAQQAAEVKTTGSIWSAEGRLVRLGTDAKAVRLHDVVSIVVSESLAASTDGQVKNSRASNANSGLTSLFGALKSSNALQNLVGMTAASGLSAQGQSTTNSSLATTFGGEVVDVLPNGMLVVQATRQLEAVEVEVFPRAKVVVNERTGTVVIGGTVRLQPVSTQRAKDSVERAR